MILVRRGHRGRKVVDVQTKLTRLGFNLGRTGIDGIFGPATEKAVRAFQEKRSLEVDGIVGPETWHEIVEASYHLGDRQLYLKEPPFRGDDVREIQATLNNLGFNAGRVTGSFGRQTDQGVRDFQKNVGLPIDGIVGETTIEVMDNLKKRVRSGEITGVWERELKGISSSPLKDRRLALDFSDDERAEEMARALGKLAEAEEALVFFARTAGQNSDTSERAKVANKKEADVLISIDVGPAESETERGCRCYYFATGDFFSARSKTLAELIQNELTLTLNLTDQGVEGKNLTILKGTRMPAVVIRLADGDAGALQIAQGILTALKRYWEGKVEIEAPVW